MSEKEKGIDLICHIVTTIVAASKAAAEQVRNLKNEPSNDSKYEDTVELKSLKTIVDYLFAEFPTIKGKNIKSKKKVGDNFYWHKNIIFQVSVQLGRAANSKN